MKWLLLKTIRYAGCPIYWQSKLQTEIALSTAEAEYIALSQALRETLPMTGLIGRVVEALGLDDGYAHTKHTPAETKPLVKDADGAPAVEGFSYSSVVGMLLYLSGHTRPDIAYAVNCCARYMFSPTRFHKESRVGNTKNVSALFDTKNVSALFSESCVS